MKPCAKCMLCSCCCGIVFIGIAIPVFIFAVLPGMTQTNLDKTAMALTNSTLLACDNFNSAPYQAELINEIEIHSDSPVSVTLEPASMTLTGYMCFGAGGVQPEFACKAPVPVELGTFTMASAKLKKGDNKVVSTATLAVSNRTTVQVGFMFGILTNHSLRLTIEAKDVSVKVLDMITVSKLDLKKDMTCKMLGKGTPPNPVTSREYCDKGSGQVVGVEMECVSGAQKLQSKAVSSSSQAAILRSTSSRTNVELIV